MRCAGRRTDPAMSMIQRLGERIAGASRPEKSEIKGEGLGKGGKGWAIIY